MNFDDFEAVIRFAIEKEIEAAAFYEEAANLQAMSSTRQMFLEFAGEEKKHRQMLENLDQTDVSKYRLKWITDIKRSDYLVDIAYHPGMDYREILLLAMKREEKALALYNEILAGTEKPNLKKLFKVLCQEEAKHKLALETLYDDHMAKLGD